MAKKSMWERSNKRGSLNINDFLSCPCNVEKGSFNRSCDLTISFINCLPFASSTISCHVVWCPISILFLLNITLFYFQYIYIYNLIVTHIFLYAWFLKYILIFKIFFFSFFLCFHTVTNWMIIYRHMNDIPLNIYGNCYRS